MRIPGLDLRVAGFSRSDIPFEKDEARHVGRNKMFTACEMLWSGMGMKRPPARDKIEQAVDTLMEALFPRPEVGPAWTKRLAAARQVWKAGGFENHIVDLTDA